jgi:SAM-dependent methyltransferase
VILVLYTTRYRKGGPSFERAATTMARELRQQHPGVEVRCQRVESKAEVRAIFAELVRSGQRITELRFVLHAGMYGPMFGTTAWPEQFSPHEWRTMEIPFAAGAQAYFHACRSARWFAPFFARTFGVRSHGYHWYTAFSTDPRRFRWPPPWRGPDEPLYVFGCPGNKSHGRAASVRKYLGLQPAEAMIAFDPDDIEGRASYDAVAGAYDEVFDDITVRHDEVRWLEARLDALDGPRSTAARGRASSGGAAGPSLRVLDLGCGNGALLQRLAPRIAGGLGVDASAAMVERARQRCAGLPHVRIERVDGPRLPAEDGSIDVAISMLSFRYLDWDPMLAELRRVLRPSGRLFVIDMVDKPVEARHVPRMLLDKARTAAHAVRASGYRERLAAMVRRPEWQDMLKYNPMRALHEYEWYLGSRFPQGRMDTLNYGRRARIIAFDSGPFERAEIVEMQYP